MREGEEAANRQGGRQAGSLMMMMMTVVRLPSCLCLTVDAWWVVSALRFVSAVLGPARMGAGLLLRDGRSAALVGETMLPNPLSGTPIACMVALCKDGSVLAVQPADVRNVEVETGHGLHVRREGPSSGSRPTTPLCMGSREGRV